MFKLTGFAKFQDGLIVTDYAVYKYIRKHSNIWDRLNPKKMVEMSFWAFNILNGSASPLKKGQKFYK